MPLPCLALSIFLFFGLGFRDLSPAPASAVKDVEITYGSVIKLMHEGTRFRLHSHEVPYGSGSEQQSVTGFPNVDDSNSYWIIRDQPDSSSKQGGIIQNGAIIRLQHMRTRKWLHSHLHASPISGNLEVGRILHSFSGYLKPIVGDPLRRMLLPTPLGFPKLSTSKVSYRACGFVSLENLLFFAQTYLVSYKRILLKQEGTRAVWEYPFAVAGINITSMLIQMLDLYSGHIEVSDSST